MHISNRDDDREFGIKDVVRQYIGVLLPIAFLGMVGEWINELAVDADVIKIFNLYLLMVFVFYVLLRVLKSDDIERTMKAIFNAVTSSLIVSFLLFNYIFSIDIQSTFVLFKAILLSSLFGFFGAILMELFS